MRCARESWRDAAGTRTQFQGAARGVFCRLKAETDVRGIAEGATARIETRIHLEHPGEARVGAILPTEEGSYRSSAAD